MHEQHALSRADCVRATLQTSCVLLAGWGLQLVLSLFDILCAHKHQLQLLLNRQGVRRLQRMSLSIL